MASFTAAAHRVRDVGPADDPVLHLLFDVRVPADRRPDLVVRRPARPRLPAGRDRGPHDADRRGAAALRRAVAACSRSRTRTAARTTPRSRTRSAVIVRDGIRRMYGPSPRTASTTSPSTTRTTCSRRCRRASRTGIVRGHVPVPRRRRRRVHTARRSSRAARWCCRRSRRSSCSPSTTTSPPTCGACPVGSSCATTRSTCERWNRLHPTDAAAHAVRHRAARGRRGPGRRGHRLGEAGARLRSPGSCPSPTSCSAPTATASPTCAPRCAGTSRSTPPTCGRGARRRWRRRAT